MMLPDWLAILILFLGVAIGWVSRMAYDAEARKDEQTIDDALSRAYQAGWRSARDKAL